MRLHARPLLGALALGALAAAACGGSSPAAQPQSAGSGEPTLAASATPPPGECPVDQAICDFARDLEAAIQRGDAWDDFPADAGIIDPWNAGPGQRIHAGGASSRLVSIGCPAAAGAAPTCDSAFALTFSFADGPDPAAESQPDTIVVGFARQDGIRAIGLAVPGKGDVLFDGGESGIPGYRKVLFVTGKPQVERVVFTPVRRVDPRPDTSLGVTAPELRQTDDIDLPPDTSILVAEGGYGHGPGGYYRLVRYTRSGHGAVVKRILLGGPDPRVDASLFITGIQSNADGSVLSLATCNDECISEGPPGPKAHTVFQQSRDGGLTWTTVTDQPGRWWLWGMDGAEMVAVRFEGGTEWRAFPSGKAVPRPPGVPESAYPEFFGGAVGWPGSAAAELIAQDGTSALRVSVAYQGAQQHNVVLDGAFAPAGGPMAGLLAVTTTGPDLPLPVGRYVVLISPDSPHAISAATRVDWRGSLTLDGWADDQRPFVTATFTAPNTCLSGDGAPETVTGARPAILDVVAGTLSFLREPGPCEAGSQRLVAVIRGPFRTVNTPGDCLNLRESPDAAAHATTCLADGVLVHAEDEDGDWVAVTAPSGQSGWVASEFLAP